MRELDEAIRVNLILVGISARRKSPHIGQMYLRRGWNGIETGDIWQTWLHRAVEWLVCQGPLWLYQLDWRYPYSIGLVVEFVSKSLPNPPLLCLYIYTNYIICSCIDLFEMFCLKGGNLKIWLFFSYPSNYTLIIKINLKYIKKLTRKNLNTVRN